MTIYAIDFDGTIVTEEYPAIGKPIQATIEFIRAIQKRGAGGRNPGRVQKNKNRSKK